MLKLGADGWFEGAIRRPGPSWKVNGGVNPSTMFVGHSVVGYRDSFYDVMMGPDRKSVHLFNPKTGPLEQLYPVTAQCWGTGHATPNNNGLTMELEGGSGDPAAGDPYNASMTPSQFDNTVELLTAWAGALHPGFDVVHQTVLGPGPLRASVWDHNQWYATACPSGRYDWRQLLLISNDQLHQAPVNPPIPPNMLGTPDAGIEFRQHQIVFWVGGIEVLSIGDPEGDGLGRLAKRFGNEWLWLKLWPTEFTDDPGAYNAYWDKKEGD